MTPKGKNFRQLQDAILLFSEDAVLAEKNIDTSDTPYNRRAMVRALFAMIEGTIFILKQMALATAAHQNILNTGELLLLEEKIPEITSKGECRMQTKYINLKDNLTFVSHVIKRLHGFTLQLGKDATHWEQFEKTIKVRNRITHPKDPNDLWVSDEDLKNIRAVSSWFFELLVDAMEQLFTTIVVPRLHAIEQNVSLLSDSLKEISDAKIKITVEQHLQEIRKILKNSEL